MGSDTRYGCSPAFRRLPVCGAAPVAGTEAVAAAAREEGKEQEHGMCPGTAGQRSRRPLGGGTSPPAGGQRGRERGQEPARPSPAALAGRGTGPRGLPGRGRERGLGFPPPRSSSFPGDFDPGFRARPPVGDGSRAVQGPGGVPPQPPSRSGVGGGGRGEEAEERVSRWAAGGECQTRGEGLW